MTAAKALYSASLNFTVLTNQSVIEAHERFAEYQDAGVIADYSTFNDSVWQTTDEYSNVGLHFNIRKTDYFMYEKFLAIDYDTFMVRLKTYLISLFGKNALSTIREVLLDIKRIIKHKPEQVYKETIKLHLSAVRLCADFFLMISDGSEKIERLVDSMDSYADVCSMRETRQRTLAELDTYFRFNDIICEYWESELSEKDRMFYYPLYLWWQLTAVLPLRPREFILTRRKCLEIKDGRYYLYVRRNWIKGSGKKVTYKLDTDYRDERYHIPEKLGKEIEKYISCTENYRPTDIETLFIPDPHYHKWERSRADENRYLTYSNMNTILRYFYAEVVTGIYKLNVLHENPERHLNDNEIQYIHLGDTRHIALINIMQEGGTPVTAMLLAGHDGTDMAAHYYSNVTSLIECRTYRQYRKMVAGDINYHLSGTAFPYIPCKCDGIPLADGGLCISELFHDENMDDCKKAVGPNGEIGYCPVCHYYKNPRLQGFKDENIYKGQLYSDCKLLSDAVSLIREGKGCTEDLGEVFLKLNASSRSYQEYLSHKRMKEGT
jgi:hypothetical protein